MSEMKDITGTKLVEVVIRQDGKVLWVNTEEEGCILRICQIENLELYDKRKERGKTNENELGE